MLANRNTYCRKKKNSLKCVEQIYKLFYCNHVNETICDKFLCSSLCRFFFLIIYASNSVGNAVLYKVSCHYRCITWMYFNTLFQGFILSTLKIITQRTSSMHFGIAKLWPKIWLEKHLPTAYRRDWNSWLYL